MTELEYREKIDGYCYFYEFDNRLVFLVSNEKVPAARRYPKTASEDPCGNGILYKCMHLWTLLVNDWLKMTDVDEFVASIRACMVKEKGLVQRSPNKPDLQSHDDLVFLMAALSSFPIHPGTAELMRDIYFYCQQETKGPWYCPKMFKYVYNTETPGKFFTPSGKVAWLHYPHLWAHFNYCMRKPVGKFLEFLYRTNLDMSINAKKSNHTSWVLTWSMLVALSQKDFNRYEAKIAAWERAYLEKFKGDENGLFKNAVSEGHPVGEAFKYAPFLAKL